MNGGANHFGAREQRLALLVFLGVMVALGGWTAMCALPSTATPIAPQGLEDATRVAHPMLQGALPTHETVSGVEDRQVIAASPTEPGCRGLPALFGCIEAADTGAPIAIERVVLLVEPAQRRTPATTWPICAERTTADAGTTLAEFRIPAASRRPVWVLAFAAGYAPVFAGPFHLVYGRDIGPLRLIARRGVPARGVVRDEHGEPIVGATIAFRSQPVEGEVADPTPENCGACVVDRVRSGATGAFVSRPLVTGRYLVTVERPGCSRTEVCAALGADQPPLAIVLSRGGGVEGCLVGAPPGALPRLRIMARCATRQCSTVVVPVSAGAFSIPCLPPGSWRLLLAEAELAQASWAQAAEIVTRPGAVERVALDLRGLGWSELRGHVVLDGRPVADATVTVSRSPLGSGPSVRSDTDGRFGFPSLAAGRWFVTIGGSTDRAAVRRVVDLGSPTAGTLELDLATGTLHGHVEDADRGAAAASRIEVSDAWGAPVATATTDARGDFALRLAASQAYSLRAVRGDRASTQRQVAVASSHTTYAGDVSLRRGGRLRLQVCRVDGSDLIGTIYVEVRAPSGDSLLSISLAAAREVELEGLPPGPVAITAREHGDTAVGTAAPRVALDRVQVARIQLGRTASAPTLRR